MPVHEHEQLAENLRGALMRPSGSGGDTALTAALARAHPADIAEVMEELTHPDCLAIFNWLDNERAAEVLDEIDSELAHYLIENAPPGRIANLLNELPMDDAAEVLAEASPEQAEALLAEMESTAPEDAADVRELLSYDEHTAGRLMTDRFVRLGPDITVRQAFSAIRRIDDRVETLTDLYVTVPAGQYEPAGDRLIGVLSLRELVRSRPNRMISEIMATNLVTVDVDTDEEEVARLIAKYDFLAMPVLDRNGYLVGIVTVDDVLDVLVEEQTEDMLKMGAVSGTDKPYLAVRVFAAVRQRFGWLLLLFVAETATGTVLRHFQDELAKAVALSFFIPLLIGTGGNAGSQTVTTITRALALGELRFSDWLRVFWRETRVGLVLGGALAIVGFFRAQLWGTTWQISLVVGLSMILILVWANMVGSLLPIAAKRLGIDPAVMSAPFIATVVDASGLFFYFTIAHYIIHI